MDAVNIGTTRHYFDLLETTLKDNNLLHSPGHIYNIDETGVPLDPKAPNVIVRTGSKKVRYRATGKKGQVYCGCMCQCVWTNTAAKYHFRCKKCQPFLDN